MAKQIFINLPVKDLKKSIEFFTKLGLTFNPQFTDDNATCMIVADNIFVMLLVENYFKTFTKKEIADTKKTTEVLICIDADSRDAVDDLVSKAVDAGGSVYADTQDYGWMYNRNFTDLDGHQWEVAYMDMSAFPQNS